VNNSTIIGVFCYNRAAKLKACIDALLKNPECPDMDIIFFSDGFRNEKSRKGVLEVREYIDSIKGFRNVYKHYRPKNLSTGPNFQEGLTYLSENYDQFIIVEDDLVVSPNYISYLMQSLAFYKDQKSVFCVTAFCFPLILKDYSYDTVIYKRFCSYGWAGWSDRMKDVIWDLDKLSNLITTSPNFKKRLNAEGYDLFRMLDKQIKGVISTWDIQMQVHVAENRLKVVYPVLSKVTNIGFDTESTNTFGVDYLKTPLDTGLKRNFNFADENHIVPELQKQIKKPYGLKALVTRKIINTIIKLTSQAKKAG
jgi:glycosyltransferase involved in cell wall biosynthesis